ncbi:hypothetical protein B0H14DRAFT_2599020 [Mycena olivaceomarginata]|nr:hypothetical protein B0H14DRAFT_2599020 [Mycena olivaceomarginata]
MSAISVTNSTSAAATSAATGHTAAAPAGTTCCPCHPRTVSGFSYFPCLFPHSVFRASVSDSEDEDEEDSEDKDQAADFVHMDLDPNHYTGWPEEDPFVYKLFWEVWDNLPEQLRFWQEVLDAVRLKIEGEVMDQVDSKLRGYIDDAVMQWLL